MKKIITYADVGSFRLNLLNFSNGLGDGGYYVYIFSENEIKKVRGRKFRFAQDWNNAVCFGYDKFTLYRHDCEKNNKIAFEKQCDIFHVFLNTDDNFMVIVYK